MSLLAKGRILRRQAVFQARLTPIPVVIFCLNCLLDIHRHGLQITDGAQRVGDVLPPPRPMVAATCRPNRRDLWIAACCWRCLPQSSERGGSGGGGTPRRKKEK